MLDRTEDQLQSTKISSDLPRTVLERSPETVSVCSRSSVPGPSKASTSCLESPLVSVSMVSVNRPESRPDPSDVSKNSRPSTSFANSYLGIKRRHEERRRQMERLRQAEKSWKEKFPEYGSSL